MLELLQQNMLDVLRHEEGDNIGSELRREGIGCIQMHGSGLGGPPEGSFKTIHAILNTLLPKNGSATEVERVKIRCIGALGLAIGYYGENIPSELSGMCTWLFSIAVSPSEKLASTVSKRAGYILNSDKIVQTQ
ncbi:hypothetical protein KBB89_02420 [Candidatus Gracilibacteria bacterium]|nr:hypothetical protein [Candidatus Gracilibacteria bacterium]